MNFSYLDIFLTILITFSTLFGAYRGFIFLALRLITLLITLGLTYLVKPYLERFLSHYIEHQLIIELVAAAGSFLIIYFCLSLLSHGLYQRLSPITKGVIDHLLGLAFGLLRGFIVALGIYLALALFTTNSYGKAANAQILYEQLIEAKKPLWLESSKTNSWFPKIIDKILPFLPKDFLKNIALPTEQKQDILDFDKAAANEQKISTIIMQSEQAKALDSELEQF